MDEAFVIGFTMGSTHQVSTAEESLFRKITKHIYPHIYRFEDNDIAVFKDAVRLGSISRCTPLDNFNFEPWLNHDLKTIRDALMIECGLIEAYYAVEKQRYPHSKASQRL